MEKADVVVIGSGPAGLHASIELARRGVSVVVLEREREAGGVPLWCHHHTFPCRIRKRLFTGPGYAQTWLREAEKLSVPFRTSTTVLRIHPDRPVVEFTSPRGTGIIEARAVLLATGARESHRHQRLAGGDRSDGVYTTASVFQCASSKQGLKHRKFVVFGAEDVSYSCLNVLLQQGAHVAAVLEPTGAVRSWQAARFYFEKLRRVPHFFDVRDLSLQGRPLSNVSFVSGNAQKTLSCDAVAFTGGFTPNSELLRTIPAQFNFASRGPSIDQSFQTSLPWLFAAGNCLRGVVSGDEAAHEGRQAAAVIASFVLAADSATPRSPIRLEGPLAYCFPDHLSSGSGPVQRISLWPSEHVRRGELIVRADDSILWRARITAAQPSRRLFVPIAPLLATRSTDYTITLDRA